MGSGGGAIPTEMKIPACDAAGIASTADPSRNILRYCAILTAAFFLHPSFEEVVPVFYSSKRSL
jgi:hypothetical protein